MQFQKKKQGQRKKKKKRKDDKFGASGSDISACSVSEEGLKSTGNGELEASDGSNLEAVLPVKEKEPGKKGFEDVSQADTDQDAPSIASEVASPIPFDVSNR